MKEHTNIDNSNFEKEEDDIHHEDTIDMNPVVQEDQHGEDRRHNDKDGNKDHEDHHVINVANEENDRSSSTLMNTTTAIAATATATHGSTHKVATKLPPMNLLQCHKFHTHPAISGPNARSHKVSHPPHPFTSTSSTAVVNAQHSSSTSTSHSPLSHHANTTTKRDHGTSSSSHITGHACHNQWAPNKNHCKNAELLAIASPISPMTIGSSHWHGGMVNGGGSTTTTTTITATGISFGSMGFVGGGAGGGGGTGGGGSGSTLGAIAAAGGGGVEMQNSSSVMGSHVYILVFDEGTFAHCTDFSLGDELCELFGMPTEKIMGRRKISRRCNHDADADEYDDDDEYDGKGMDDCGLRRKVFHGGRGNKKDKQVVTDLSAVTKESSDKDGDLANGGHGLDVQETNVVVVDNSGGGDQDGQKQNHGTLSSGSSSSSSLTKIWENNLFQKTQSVCGEIATKFVKPFAFHIWDEIRNCIQLFQYQVFHDGRIFHLGLKNGNDNDVDEEDGVHKREASESAPCLVRPQLVFHVKLPYSNTSMEVTGLEWNKDGTVLSITQRKKGSAVGGSYMVASSSTNLTNKKKKSSASSSSLGGSVVVSPGNTAISFWSIPEWLHVSCDDLKVCHDDETLRCSDADGVVVKATHRQLEDTAGWETALPDESRSLFPLWEWYLSRYVYRDENSTGMQYGAMENRKKRSRIMIKNFMDYYAYPMELMDTSSSSSSSSCMVKQVKRTPRGIKSVSHPSENANAIINGDITCIFWEESPIFKNDIGIKGSELDDKKVSGSKKGNDKSSSKGRNSNFTVAPKWVAVGTSKGQVILHNCVASLTSFQSKKNGRKFAGKADSKTAGLSPDSILPQARTISIPVRHKKRITCGTWVENLLVFGQLSTGCLTIVSTCVKPSLVDENVGSCEKMDLFSEKSAKVIGNIVLPGGRDAVEIKIRDLVTDVGSLSVLSVNCEGKSLLFYTFPKFINSIEISAQASDIISSPATEVIFSKMSNISAEDPLTTKKGSGICGNIICHYPIPNTLLVLVGFSCGYFALVDWANGVILSDENVVQRSYLKSKINTDVMSRDYDNFLLDVAYHEETSTFACMTKNGCVLVYHIRVLEGYHNVQAGDCECSTGITIHTKNHTKPKTKATKSLVDCDSSLKRIMGTIDYLCAHSIPFTPCLQGDTRREELINFSSDGECLSVSLGDESVIILSINADDDEVDRLKRRLAESIYLGRKKFTLTLLTIVGALLLFTSMATSPETTRLFLIRLCTMLKLNNGINM